MVIDLTLSTRRVGSLTKWEIDKSLDITSDHEVIGFEWIPLNPVTLEGKMDGAQSWDLNQLYADEQTLKAASKSWLELSKGRALIDA